MAFFTRSIRLASISTQRASFSTRSALLKQKPLSTDSSVASEQYPDSEHATQKSDKLDVQSSNSAQGRQDKANDTGGTATRQADERNSAGRMKDEFPESPDPSLGAASERGGKGA